MLQFTCCRNRHLLQMLELELPSILSLVILQIIGTCAQGTCCQEGFARMLRSTSLSS
uniref:Uncharacterized protein n=1 Tax=Arundo donax TaxID=35708 RepID=A0A0A8Y4K9_ARUDO